MIETLAETAHQAVQLIFARMAERRVAYVMREGQCFGEIFIHAQDAGNRSRDLRYLDGMGESIAEVIVPHIRARPITMERYPSGIGKKGFIQKDVSKGFPSWLERVEAPRAGGEPAPRFDLVLSDIMMPKISGFDVLDILRAGRRNSGAL